VHVQLARADHVDVMRKLHAQLLPTDPPLVFPRGSVWFVALDGDDVVGFAGVKFHRKIKTAELLLTLVRPSHRGKGLQRRLIAARERAARRAGMTRAVTYTMIFNVPSATNLAKARYATYRPVRPWATRQVVYWEKRL
jgi:GNAT superfamily N-acetyltransferase